ncbi:E3 ubiquitin-protein ligase BOI-like [Aegilops tauschii subsp. strangulata]|uniref:RING-type domain-containing protein n=4 Tax=Triticinae TaxID=1648030 RepID=A0A453NBX2_AEGTS|nr:E3 ubiquitin-protein ligase BOI-like [Aegilops tauschii subsp. strangulata]
MILGTGHHQPAAAHGLAAGASAAAMPMSSGPLYGSAVPSQQGDHSGLAAAPIPSPTLGVELDGAQEMTTNNKRKREEQSAAAFGAAQAQQQPMVVDRSLRNEAERFCNTLEEEMRRHEKLMLSTVEAMVEKRLLAKDQEIMHNWGVNCALGERLKTLYMEAEAWRMDAQSKQTEANVLRADLERALAQQAVRYHGSGSAEGEGEEDAESCCWGDYHAAFCGGEEVETPVVEPPVTGAGMCKGCGENTPVAVLLPCRHLSVCGTCAEALSGCPSCGCATQGSIYINFS